MKTEFIVNVFEIQIAPVGSRRSKAIQFGHADVNAIKIVDDHLLNVKNKVAEVMALKAGSWTSTPHSIYVGELKKDVSAGVFYGRVEVGRTGTFDRLRKRDGSEPYKIKSSDLSMRDFFFRIEMPSDSTLGFLVVQRRGRNTPGNAIQQTLRQQFHQRDYSAHFRLVTDSERFDEYLNGRLIGVKARYVPAKTEARKAVKNSLVFASELSRAEREEMDIQFKVNRPLGQTAKKKVKDWLLGDSQTLPQIVTLPVDDNPDKLYLRMLTDDGNTKQLSPDMIDDMALTVDLTASVRRGTDGRIDLESANKEVAKLCAKHRPVLVNGN